MNRVEAVKALAAWIAIIGCGFAYAVAFGVAG